MKVKEVVEALLEIKKEFPALTNQEVFEVMKIKLMMEGNVKNGRYRNILHN